MNRSEVERDKIAPWITTTTTKILYDFYSKRIVHSFDVDLDFLKN